MRHPRERSGTRCAIYTRKSTEEGLEQAFNSLDAQREACAAYISSQRHEGWSLVPELYDDGGYSGANMDRPALRHLLTDIRSGKVDTVVVYKVDRLTRSLADFAKIVDVLDAHKASFVSVTQAFNTTTSMGRLTLNVLLSFAQFEREVTGERIRDKIAASKAKGMWMGGVVPLGYLVRERKLVVAPDEAARVRAIYERYLELGSVMALANELADQGVRSKSRIGRTGRQLGDAPFSRGALYLMLQNRIYLGEIRHKDKAYPGEQEPIISNELFERAGALLALNRNSHADGAQAADPSLLLGKVWDAHGRRMLPDHCSKRGKRYRYYASDNRSHRLKQRPQRVPAGDLEAIVIAQLRPRLDSEITAPLQLAIDSANLTEWRRLIAARVDRVEVHADRIDLTISDAGEPELVSVPAPLIRLSGQTRLAVPPDTAASGQRDAALIKLVVKAHVARDALASAGDRSIREIAEEQGYSKDYFGVLLRISYLAPDILAAILDGRQPLQLNRQRLARATNLPIEWQQQREMLGFG